MRWLAAGLTFVSSATVAGLIFGIVARGLSTFTATVAFSIGIILGTLALFQTSSDEPAPPVKLQSAWDRYRGIWKWLLAFCFLVFAVRSFCWLVYIDGEELHIQSPNNLGDLALHLTFIKNFANGVPLWPDNPIFDGSKLRYPAGVDLFNALLSLQRVQMIPGLVWVGLLGSLATFCAFQKWGGPFAVAAFLFNGGLVGFKFLESYQFSDYQGMNDVAWKSLPIAMLVTQRGLLYAIPAGLFLLWSWREKFYRGRNVLPFWVELLLYASMPLFHVHTFLALSAVLACFFFFDLLNQVESIRGLIREKAIASKWQEVFGQPWTRVTILVAAAFVPATFFVWLITDHFHAGSVFDWQPGWVQSERNNEMAAPFLIFWLKNFGLWMPLLLVLLGFVARDLYRSNRIAMFEGIGAIAIFSIALCCFRFWKIGFGWRPAIVALVFLALLVWAGFVLFSSANESRQKLPEAVVFLIAGIAIFIFGLFVKTAPWGWDNLKLMMWGYFLVVPVLWQLLIKDWSIPIRSAAMILLFGSGFVTLIGGLAAGRPGFGFVYRGEVDGVGHALRAGNFPIEARFAAYPTYNHPLLIQGRDVVLGYPGHLWTEGYDYGPLQNQLTELMIGAANWRDVAQRLQVRYLYWGRQESSNYPTSTRPWEKQMTPIAAGNWGVIYDLGPTTNTHE